MSSRNQKSDSWWSLSFWDKLDNLCLRPIFFIPAIPILGFGLGLLWAYLAGAFDQ